MASTIQNVTSKAEVAKGMEWRDPTEMMRHASFNELTGLFFGLMTLWYVVTSLAALA